MAAPGLAVALHSQDRGGPAHARIDLRFKLGRGGEPPCDSSDWRETSLFGAPLAVAAGFDSALVNHITEVGLLTLPLGGRIGSPIGPGPGGLTVASWGGLDGPFTPGPGHGGGGGTGGDGTSVGGTGGSGAGDGSGVTGGGGGAGTASTLGTGTGGGTGFGGGTGLTDGGGSTSGGGGTGLGSTLGTGTSGGTGFGGGTELTDGGGSTGVGGGTGSGSTIGMGAGGGPGTGGFGGGTGVSGGTDSLGFLLAGLTDASGNGGSAGGGAGGDLGGGLIQLGGSGTGFDGTPTIPGPPIGDGGRSGRLPGGGGDDLTQSAVLTGEVPEPASWATMLFGFGVIGGALRARRRKTARA